MRKLIMSSVLTVAVAGATAFGQGYINFGGVSRTVWNNTGSSSVYGTITGPTTDSGFAATFLWSATATTTPMPTASVPTNNSTAFSYSQAWTAVEGASASGWTTATTAGANVYGLPANNLGSFTANGAVAFGLDGSTGSGEAINIFALAWETEGGLYNTLAAAEAAGAPVGWSSVFGYTLGAAPPATPPAQTATPKFGIGGPTVPEPTALALAALGGLPMFFLRRKKSLS